MKNKKTFIIAVTFIIIAIGGYFLYSNFYKPKDKYILKKHIETDISFSKYTTGKKHNNILFVYDYNNDFFRIYNKSGEDITPDNIKNSKTNNISEFTNNNTFLGFFLQTENNESYYINETGKMILETKNNIYNTGNYIIKDSDEICYKNTFDGVEYDYNCQQIYDLNGKLLIDGTENNYHTFRVIYDKNNNTLFETKKNTKVGIVDKNGKIIIDFNYQSNDYIETKNIILSKKEDKIYHIYDINGKLLKEINLNNIKITKENKYSGATDLGENIYYYLNDTLYLINNNELQEYNDIYYELETGEEFYKQYYITDDIYIKNTNNIYTVHNLAGKQIINEEFKFIGPANEDGQGAIGVPNGYITLCKNENRTNCGAIDFKGNILIEFENELYKYSEEYSEEEKNIYSQTFYGFKNGNNYFDIQDGKVTNKLTCNNISDIIVNKYFDDAIYVSRANIEFNKGGNQLIDYRCNELSEAKYHNIYKYDNFIIAQNTNWVTYDVYDKNGTIVNYKNKDNGKTTNFLGYNDNKLYFGYQKEIYILEENK